ncbi:PDDEXK family nuclease [Halobacterium rubrum]|uniref:hypothetical protein n=1 Tax=Halobacterium TaxID=2239 RepID=UPI001F2F0BB2|nr:MULTISPECIES: hypothetical protein [Halobacterium]MDH5021818.1 hypothetical protein [Halobacterium rubrum]
MPELAGDPANYKVYWFSRDLVASRFGSFATKESQALRELADDLQTDIARGDTNPADCRQTIEEQILGSVNRTYAGDISKRYRQTEDLVERVQRRIDTIDDVEEFILGAKAVVRTSDILDETSRFGEEDIKEIVHETLSDDRGEVRKDRAFDALYNVDFEGEAHQLGAQREPLIEYVCELMDEIDGPERSPEYVARIISGIAQEYERRAGQSRAATAGNVLETALQEILNLFDIPATGSPEHFGDIEIDNIAKGPQGKIGFSCKRTLRERFRQSLSRQAEIGVDEVWFVSLMMADVSREKLVDISNDGGRIYVPRDSFVWDRYSEDDEISYALRPADQFIEDVADFVGA